ncbi:MAG TPA: branched-chain amino acid ABC transporter substrate-binding protein, partial [Pseudomonas sp.]|nr:branched-chain amino acid ABC transporter substrate-binding protein [Pseudomonas sp.]
RWMNDRDFAAWMGVRSLAAAVTRLRSTDAAAIRQLSLSGEL